MVPPVERGSPLIGAALTDLIRAVMEKGDAFRYPVSGRSMRPFLRDGDLLTISRVDPDDLAGGDVVAFAQPESGRLVFHRITRLGRGAVTTKGDNLARSDGRIPHDRLLGVVTEYRRGDRIVPLPHGRRRGRSDSLRARTAILYGYLWPPLRAILRRAFSPRARA